MRISRRYGEITLTGYSMVGMAATKEDDGNYCSSEIMRRIFFRSFYSFRTSIISSSWILRIDDGSDKGSRGWRREAPHWGGRTSARVGPGDSEVKRRRQMLLARRLCARAASLRSHCHTQGKSDGSPSEEIGECTHEVAAKTRSKASCNMGPMCHW
jgi:hypothetical protein